MRVIYRKDLAEGVKIRVVRHEDGSRISHQMQLVRGNETFQYPTTDDVDLSDLRAMAGRIRSFTGYFREIERHKQQQDVKNRYL